MPFNNDKELYKTIGTNVQKFRKKSGLTQTQLSEYAKISISYLSKIEAAGCEKSFSISVLNQIANALNIDVRLLLEENENA